MREKIFALQEELSVNRAQDSPLLRKKEKAIILQYEKELSAYEGLKKKSSHQMEEINLLQRENEALGIKVSEL